MKLYLIGSAILLSTLVSFADEKLPDKENFHLFLLVGQSNMAGRGKVAKQDLVENPNVLALGKDLKWKPAVDPIHFDKKIAGVGLGKSFGLHLLKDDPNITIGLIPCAVGGSPISSWEPEGYHPSTKTHPWDDMLPRAREAMKHGTLKGILWHQGESDSKPELADIYQNKLHQLVQRFRKELNAPEVPFICGQMGIFAERPWDQHRKKVDYAHQTLPAHFPNTRFVSSKGLGHKGDEVHFSAAAYRTLGKKFADEYLKLTSINRRIATGNGSYHQIKYAPSTETGKLSIGVTHTLWIPDGVTTLRGIMVHQHGCGPGAGNGGETAPFDLHWQALAKKWDCALLGPRYHQWEHEDCRNWCDPRRGSADIFVQAIADLAAKSDHPELTEIPWCLWGHSGGGFWASLMQMIHPEKIAGIWFQSGTAHSRWVSGEIEKPTIPDSAMQIPMIANPGFGERDHQRFKVAYKGCFEMVKDYRSHGGLIAFAPDPLSGHETRDSRYLAIPFFDAVLSQRLPDKAGTGDLKPAAKGVETPLHENYVELDDPMSPSKETVTNWLPNQAIATKWAEFVKQGDVSDSTPPPAPSQVKVEDGKITWTAQPDFESGIQAFTIWQGDKQIGTVPDERKSRFGRPLFQGMTYNDTPEPPLREMKFTDPTIKKDGKYIIRSVNSVGLVSE